MARTSKKLTDRQTDNPRHTIIRPVDDGRIDGRIKKVDKTLQQYV
jgi:hypothetical protein